MSCWQIKLTALTAAMLLAGPACTGRGADADTNALEAQHVLNRPPEKAAAPLSASFALEGKVVNAATQEPIGSFRLLSAGMDEAGVTRWRRERIYRGRNGAFSVNSSDFGSPPVFLRVEADGFEPAFSDRLAEKAAGSLSLDFRLKKSGPIRGKVTLPDGEPGWNATVALCTEFSAPVLSLNFFQRSPQYPTQKTGDHGQFTFAPEPEALRFAAVHAQGYGEALCGPAGDSPTIALQAWGAVEGSLRSWTTGEPEPGMVAVLTPDATIPSLFVRLGLVVLDGAKYTVETGEKGLFTITNVPPGDRFLWHIVPFSASADNAASVSFAGKPIQIKPGETNRVALGTQPGVIQGQLMDSAGQPYEPWNTILGFLRLKPQTGNASPAQMAVTFGADGRFVVDDLPPGEFDAELEIYRPPVLVGSAHKKLAIATPDKIPATAPQDSGAWTVKSAITAKTGETAPDFEAPALAEGENIRLSQYRGKYVLIHFWATWASPRFAMLPGLKQCKAEYPQLVTIGLNLDSDAGLARHYANKTGMTGPQGWLGEWSQARLPGRYGASIPSACLISPEGKILALNIDFTALPDCLHGSKSR